MRETCRDGLPVTARSFFWGGHAPSEQAKAYSTVFASGCAAKVGQASAGDCPWGQSLAPETTPKSLIPSSVFWRGPSVLLILRFFVFCEEKHQAAFFINWLAV